MDWHPSASIETLRLRAEYMERIRTFFKQRDYLEVETPVMARFGVTDVYLSNIPAFFREERYCLQTSPEYHMKRLLAAGSGPIFQLARVFRDDELGRWHNPEFTLLEWYQLGIDHHALMDEVDALLQAVLDTHPMVRKSYRQVFEEICGLNPLDTSVSELRSVLSQYALDGVFDEAESNLDSYLFLLMSHVIEPALAAEETPVAVYAFPPSQAALAQIHDGVADRFEVYYRGVELANGFHELVDPALQQARFEQDQLDRASRGLPFAPADSYLLEAMHAGIPACSGVALGIDRLLALAFEQSSIASCMAFDFARA